MIHSASLATFYPRILLVNFTMPVKNNNLLLLYYYNLLLLLLLGPRHIQPSTYTNVTASL